MTNPAQSTARSWRLPVLIAALGAAAAAGAPAWYFWPRAGQEPQPPAVELAGVDPDVARAVEEARAAVRDAPQSADAWGRLGMVFRAHNFADEANFCFERAERLDGADARWPYLRAATVALNDRDAAIPLLERAADLAGREAAPRARLAETLFLQGRLEEAERHFRRVLDLSPDDARARLGLARIARQRGEWSKCLTLLGPALPNPSSAKSAHVLKAEALQASGDPDGARAELGRADELPPDAAWPDRYVEQVERLRVGVRSRLAFAVQLYRQGRGPEAAEVLDDVVRAAPDSDEAHFVFGQVLLGTGQHAAAAAAFRRAAQLAPASAEARFQLGNALFLQDQFKPAAEAFREAIRLKPSHALAHHNLGLCLLKSGDTRAAADAFRAALRYRPDFAPAHLALAELLAKDGKDADALTHLERAASLAPDDARAKQLLAEVKGRVSGDSKGKQ